ncbi:MAG: M23 family metallopeptidase [Rhizobacter sp.]|nr:M23 family metallopeptidase [Chlorobiales bacterium]
MPEKKKAVETYTLAIIPEDGSETRTYGGITKERVIGLVVASGFGVAVVSLLIIVFTPIRTLIPGYADSSYRKEVIRNQVRLDSLSNQIIQLEYYNRRLRSILESAPSASDPALANSPAQDVRDGRETFVAISGAGYNSTKTAASEALFIGFVVQGRISQRFDPVRSHYGLDIATASNEPIGAFLDGTVVFADWNGEYGYTIITEHGDLLSFYKHCSKVLVQSGESVRRGQVIALTGSTGIESGGAHLHLEVWKQGIPQNPELYLNP